MQCERMCDIMDDEKMKVYSANRKSYVDDKSELIKEIAAIVLGIPSMAIWFIYLKLLMIYAGFGMWSAFLLGLLGYGATMLPLMFLGDKILEAYSRSVGKKNELIEKHNQELYDAITKE